MTEINPLVITKAGEMIALDAKVTFDDNALCLLYTSDAADERSSVDLGGRRIIKKQKTTATMPIIRESIN